MKGFRQSRALTRAGLWTLSSMLSLAAGTAVHAQTTTQGTGDASSAQSEAPGAGLNEIIVTAERRSENLQKTAVAVTALDGGELQDQGRFSLTQILEDVPNTTILEPVDGQATLDSPGNVIAIRGISSNTAVNGTYGASVVSAVGYYVDGVLNGMGGGYDISQVQVLRGPQGTLYGRSATAGAFIVKTADPELGQVTGDASLELGDYDLRHVTGGVSVPIGDTIAIRASGNFYARDGYYAKTGGQANIKEGRIKALFKPSDNFSLVLGAAFEHTKQYTGELGGRLSGLGTDDVVYDVVVPIGKGSSDQQQYWAQLTWDLGPVTLTYIPAYRTFEQDTTFYASPVPGVIVTNNVKIPRNKFYTQELRLASNSTKPLSWQAGVFYYRNELELENLGIVQGPPPPGSGLPPINRTLYNADPLTRTTENLGVFAEATYHLSDSTRFTGGLRYDYTKVVTTDHSCTGINVPGVPLPCFDLTAEDGTRSWNNVTYKARLEHDLTPTNLVYASVSTAFLPGDVTVTSGLQAGLPGAPPMTTPRAAVYEAETLTSFEIGSKNRFLGGALQVNAAAFYYKFGGHQLPVVVGVIPPPENIQLYETMGSPARMYGGELEISYLLTPNDRFDLTASYVDAYYVNKPGAVDQPATFASGVVQRRLAGVVPWNISPTYTHTFPLDNGEIVFRAQGIYRSSYSVNDLTACNAGLVSCPPPAPPVGVSLAQYLRNGDTFQGNLSLTFKLNEPDVSLTAYVRNVTDERYKTFVGLVTPVLQGNGAQLSEPRTFGLVFAAHF